MDTLYEKEERVMIQSTLCYIERAGQYLMLHRVKKENDLNHDKWVGVGGKFLDKESPEECLLREVKEETGLDVRGERLIAVQDCANHNALT